MAPRDFNAQIGEFITAHVFSNAQIFSVYWSVAGLPIGLVPLSAGGGGGYMPFYDFYSYPITLAWVVPGYYLVVCSGMTSLGPAVASHVFRVTGPAVVNFSAQVVGQAQVVQAGDKSFLQLKSMQNPATDGVSFLATVNSNGAVGVVGFMQLVNEQRMRMDTDYHWYKYSINGRWVLDTGANPGSILYRNQTWALPGAMGQAVMNASDGPGGELGPPVKAYHIGVEPLLQPERFRLFLMFRPITANPSCWVPLSEVVWQWSGAAELNANGVGYQLSDHGTAISFPATPIRFAQQLPRWEANTGAGVWMENPPNPLR